MILQSKMNYAYCSRYQIARDWLNNIPMKTWVKISDIPSEISYQVIDLLDGYFKAHIIAAFDETYENFCLMHRANVVEKEVLHLRRRHEIN